MSASRGDNSVPTARDFHHCYDAVSLVKFFRPCVYGWKRGVGWLYIGFSKHGTARFSTHHALKVTEWRQGDQLWVWHSKTDNLKELREQEARLIKDLKPFRNKTPVPWSKVKVRRWKGKWVPVIPGSKALVNAKYFKEWSA